MVVLKDILLDSIILFRFGKLIYNPFYIELRAGVILNRHNNNVVIFTLSIDTRLDAIPIEFNYYY